MDCELIEVTPGDARATAECARLHRDLLGHGPMARLGVLFLQRFCYGVLLRDGLLRAALFRVDGEPAGYVAYTGRSVTFHRTAIRDHWLRVAWLVGLSVLREPRVLLALPKATWLMVSRRSELGQVGEDPLGEVVAIGVRKEYLTPGFASRSGRRIGRELVEHAAAALRREGVGRLRMIVEAGNRPALFFYQSLGARFEPYRQHGEEMVHVWFDLDAPGAPGAPGAARS